MMVQENLHATNELKLEGVQSKPDTRSFEDLVIVSVKECFSSLGYSTKQKITSHLKEHYDISIADVPSRISDFSEALEESCGLYGKLIEIEIMKTLYEKISPFLYFPHGSDLSFVSYVETLRYFV
jgi:hypothetical protein